jgi:hypothetical protein
VKSDEKLKESFSGGGEERGGPEVRPPQPIFSSSKLQLDGIASYLIVSSHFLISSPAISLPPRPKANAAATAMAPKSKPNANTFDELYKKCIYWWKLRSLGLAPPPLHHNSLESPAHHCESMLRRGRGRRPGGGGGALIGVAICVLSSVYPKGSFVLSRTCRNRRRSSLNRDYFSPLLRIIPILFKAPFRCYQVIQE